MILSLLFPQQCLSCKTQCEDKLCSSCSSEVIESLMPKIEQLDSSGVCYHIYFAKFEGVYKRLVHAGKYRFSKSVWQFLGAFMGSSLKFKHNAFLTFVPSTWLRFCYRGFNQAQVLAYNVANVSQITVLDLLKRTRHKESITVLNKEQRADAMDGVFEVQHNKDMSGFKYCYLVDDVLTSGATMKAAALAIRSRYPHLKIIALTFAKTPKYI